MNTDRSGKFLLWPLALLLACSSGSKTIDREIRTDTREHAPRGEVHIADPDVAPGEDTLTLPEIALPEVTETLDLSPPEAVDAWVPVPCQSHDDCDGGFCVEAVPGSGEYVCTISCLEECPLDWVCKSVYLDGPDPVSICLPPGDTLCKACQADADCLLAASLCVKSTGALGYCGRSCSQADDDCPESFSCTLYVNSDGDPQGYQCAPVDGLCCEAGALAACDDDNVCTFDGCNPSLGCVHEPVDEECTGDNSCLEYFCQEGECAGVPIIADDTLNHIDDDCDGLTDEEAYKEFRLAGGTFGDAQGVAVGGDLVLVAALGTPAVDGKAESALALLHTGLLELLAYLELEP